MNTFNPRPAFSGFEDKDGKSFSFGSSHGSALVTDRTSSLAVKHQARGSKEQEIHSMVKDLSSNVSWHLSAINASPKYAERRLLWDNLSTVARLHSLPWVIAADFNEVLLGDDKYGGQPVNVNRALNFQECLNNCGMIDLGFSGPRFQPMWLSHPTFPKVVRDAWSSTSTLSNAISSFTNKARIWNRDHFGNIFHRKKRICARLKGTQNALANNPNSFLINLEKSIF
ncbi:uncharacterized protein LOC136068288 [Quercus suber]|uniref:uncharacterized protein LOC136068288 n=1 Tax=Quercus suber TaxID=58331 RepID=UPI0032DF5054